MTWRGEGRLVDWKALRFVLKSASYKKVFMLTHTKVNVHNKLKLCIHNFTLQLKSSCVNPKTAPKLTKTTASEKYIDLVSSWRQSRNYPSSSQKSNDFFVPLFVKIIIFTRQVVARGVLWPAASIHSDLRHGHGTVTDHNLKRVGSCPFITRIHIYGLKPGPLL